MKLFTDNRRPSFMSLFLATVLIAGIAHTEKVRAQDDLLDDVDSSLDMDTLNIDGKLSPSEKLRQRRERLEERNKIMVEKKIEDIRVKQEIALTNKLQDAFGKSLNNLNEDKVEVKQAAPVAPQPVVAPVPVFETKIVEEKIEPVKVEKKSKVIPYLGASSIKGEKIDWESNVNGGINLETMVLPQISVGVGVGYTSLDITDVANDFISGGVVTGPSYNGYFGTGRKMSMNKLTIEANGKFFLIEEARIKPFIGGALSYNRSNLKYEDSGNGYYYNGINYGSEGFSSTAMGATAKLGAEVDFTETVGLNVDLSYTKTLSSGLSKNASTTTTNPDQVRLENVTKSVEESDITAIQAGLVVRF